MPSILDALWQVESGGIPGKPGPQTKYGQPLGKGQTLPGTAREMAQKLGLPWRPDLLTSPTPEGERYQERVSEAYFNEGLERTGNPRDALRYYHGGPDRRQWGPKTNAYADKVLALSGGGQQPMMPRFGSGPQSLPGQSVAGLEMPGPAAMSFTDEQIGPANGGGLAEILAGLPTLADTEVQKPKPFQKGGIGLTIAGIIADGIANGFGAQPGFGPALLAEKERNQQIELWREKVAQERAERLEMSDLTLRRQMALEQYKQKNPDTPASIVTAQMRERMTPEQRANFDEYLKLTHPGMSAPFTMPEGATLQTPGQAQTTATGPNGERVRYNPQTGQWEPM